MIWMHVRYVISSVMEKKIRIGVPCLVIKGDTVLLGQSSKEGPQFKQWVIPGGGVDFCETFEATAKREILEETGLSIKNIKQFKAYELINTEKGRHLVFVMHTAEWESGEITISNESDLFQAKFLNKEEIKQKFDTGEIDPSGPVAKMLTDSGWL